MIVTLKNVVERELIAHKTHNCEFGHVFSEQFQIGNASSIYREGMDVVDVLSCKNACMAKEWEMSCRWQLRRSAGYLQELSEDEEMR